MSSYSRSILRLEDDPNEVREPNATQDHIQ